jgi:hypothetical protein
MFADQAIFALPISVDHQFFIQNFYSSDGFLVGEFGGSGYGVPITAQEFAARRTAAHLGQKLILFMCQHN